MSGRIWVVEYKNDRTQGQWGLLVASAATRDKARSIQQVMRRNFPVTRVVQYVLQGGAR